MRQIGEEEAPLILAPDRNYTNVILVAHELSIVDCLIQRRCIQSHFARVLVQSIIDPILSMSNGYYFKELYAEMGFGCRNFLLFFFDIIFLFHGSNIRLTIFQRFE